MRLHLGSRTGPPALPDFPPAPRSDAKHSFLPRNCSAAWPGSGARQPEPLASHALLHGVRSCTSSPELPPVAYEIDAVAPTLFGCCQRRWSVGSGGAENTNWRTQVFRAILERQCVLESERGSACLTRETRKQRGAVGGRAFRSRLSYRAPSVAARAHSSRRELHGSSATRCCGRWRLRSGPMPPENIELDTLARHCQKLRYARARADPCLLHACIGKRFLCDIAAKL